MSKFSVAVRKRDTKELVKSIPCTSERSAEKVQAGVELNLNHAEYYTEIEETPDVVEGE